MCIEIYCLTHKKKKYNLNYLTYATFKRNYGV